MNAVSNPKSLANTVIILVAMSMSNGTVFCASVDSIRVPLKGVFRLPHSIQGRPAASDTLRHTRMSDVVITGSRQELEAQNSPVKVDLIKRSAIERTGAINLSSVLQEQGLMANRNSLQSGVQLMGLSADYTQILIDGLPLVGRVAGVVDISRMAVGNVQQIEVVKGPMSSLYGSDALAGVINIRTQTPQSGWSSRWRTLVQSIQGVQSSLNLGYGGETMDWSLFADTRRSPSFEQRSDSLRIPYAGFVDVTAQTRLKVVFSQKADAEVSGRYFGSSSRGTFVESFYSQTAANQGSVVQQDLNGSATVNLRGEGFFVRTQIYATRYRERYDFDVVQGSGSNTDEYERSLIRPTVQANILVNDRVQVTLGSEYMVDGISGTRYPDNPSYTTGVVYAQWEGTPRDELGYALSARFDANSEFGNNISPKLAMLYKPAQDVQVRASVGTGFKAPDFRQLYVVFRNNLQGAGYVLSGARLLGRDLAAERSVSYDVSLSCDLMSLLANGTLQYESPSSFHELPSLRFDLRLYHNDVSQMIEYYLDHIESGTSVYSYRNVARVRTQGMECAVRSEWYPSESDTVAIRCSYQYLRAVDMDVVDAIEASRAGSVDRSTGRFIPLTTSAYGGLWYRSPHLVNTAVDYSTSNGLTASLRADYTGAFGDESLDRNGSVLGTMVRTVPDDSRELAAGYWNVKINIQKRFEELSRTFGVNEVLIGVGASNLLNAQNLRSIPSLIGRQFSLLFNVSF